MLPKPIRLPVVAPGADPSIPPMPGQQQALAVRIRRSIALVSGLFLALLVVLFALLFWLLSSSIGEWRTASLDASIEGRDRLIRRHLESARRVLETLAADIDAAVPGDAAAPDLAEASYWSAFSGFARVEGGAVVARWGIVPEEPLAASADDAGAPMGFARSGDEILLRMAAPVEDAGFLLGFLPSAFIADVVLTDFGGGTRSRGMIAFLGDEPRWFVPPRRPMTLELRAELRAALQETRDRRIVRLLAEGERHIELLAGTPLALVIETGPEGFGETIVRELRRWLLVLVAVAGVGLVVGALVIDPAIRAVAEQATTLEASEAFHRSVFQSATLGMVLAEVPGGRFVDVNARACEIFGRDRSELLGTNCLDLIEGDPRARARDDIERLFTGALPVLQVDRAMRRKDGAEIHVHVEAVLTGSAAGGARQVFAIIQDITERHRLEVALRRAETRFRRLWDSGIVGIAVIGGDGRVYEANDVWLRFCGTDERAIASGAFDWRSCIPPEARAQDEERWRRMIGDGFAEPDEQPFLRADGSRAHAIVSGALLERDDPDVVIVLFQDISRRIAAERALAERSADLERINVELERFAFIASHDLQAPLRLVINYLDLIERRCDDADERLPSYVRSARDSALRMRSMIEGLLAYARSGRVREEEERAVPAAEAVEEALDNLAAEIAAQDAVVHRAALPTVRIARLALVQVYQNLIANAIRYRQRGRRPEVWFEAQEEGERWRLAVRDNGRGVPPEDRERIFGIFQRGAAAEDGGSGIGLALVRRIVEDRGGRVWVESVPGEGSRFVFTVARA